MSDIQLSPHFKLSEFIKSPTATARGIDNTPSEQVISNLRNLCEQVLEPLRQHFNVPITIGSGYRCPALNSAVGGVKNSQHMTGEAADIHIPLYDFKDSNGNRRTNTELGRKWMLWIIDNTDMDQCIWETSNRRIYWIHVSCKSDRAKNRHHVISFLLKGGNK